MSEMQEAYESVVAALKLRIEWERADACGLVRVATPPNVLNEVRFLVKAALRDAQKVVDEATAKHFG